MHPHATHPRFRGSHLCRVAVCCIGLWLPVQALAGAHAPAVDDLTQSALRYLHGEGVARDIDRAVVYLCTAARKGDGAAAYELGWLYYQGRDVPRDDRLAAAWLKEARRLGETLPTRLQASLEKESAMETQPACIANKGVDLRLTDHRYADVVVAIYQMAPEYGLDPALVLEVVRAESNFNPRARSHKGALGLMQLIPATARRFGVQDPFEPLQNLRGGMAYLRWLLKRFDGNIRLMLAGYNAGEAAVERHGGVPPYRETREYVRRILRRYGEVDPLPSDALI